MTVGPSSPKGRPGGSTATGLPTSHGLPLSGGRDRRLVPKGKPFKLTAPEPREVELHAACARMLDWIIQPPAFWCSYPAGHIELSAAQAARLIRTGLKRGIPDIMIFHYAVYGIELKRRGGTLSKTRIVRTRRGTPRELLGQEDMFPRLIATGAWRAIGIASSVEEVVSLLRGWNIPMRGHVL